MPARLHSDYQGFRYNRSQPISLDEQKDYRGYEGAFALTRIFHARGGRAAPLAMGLIGLLQGGCGTSIPQVPEVWDRDDPNATVYMEKQIKLAVFCDLRKAIFVARGSKSRNYDAAGKDVTTVEDQLVPDSWGAQVTLTFTVDELSKLAPGVSLIRPIAPANLAQSFTLGLGGSLSSEATRIDKYETFYTIKELHTVFSPFSDCDSRPGEVGPQSRSSPFTILSDLGIRQWLPQAADVSRFLRSSRKAANGEGSALGSASGFSSDSFSYDIKFLIVSDFNITPTLKLVRVTTPSTSFFDTSRSRTHELLITIAPTAPEAPKKKGVPQTFVPISSAAQSHFAQEIGSAVANAIRGQTIVTP